MKIRKRYLIPMIAALLIVTAFFAVNAYFFGSGVVIYMYHSVREEPVNPDAPQLSVRPSEMEKQLKYFSESGLETIFASKLKQDDCSRAVVLTFDDGYEDNYTELFPLLKKYNCKATIFMITGKIGEEGYLSADEIREMVESGLVSVQSHTVSHEPLAWGNKEYEEVDFELAQSKTELEEISGTRVDCLSVPNGNYDNIVIDIAKQYYDVIFTSDSFEPYSDENLDDIHRVGIYRRHTLTDVKQMTRYRGIYILKRLVQKLIEKL